MSDVLGVLIAFISVILLLSMLVTGLVQATQAGLRLRGRNLLVGVASLITSLQTGNTSQQKSDTGNTGEKLRGLARSKPRQQAASILNDSTIASVDAVRTENSWPRILLGPKVSWVDKVDLEAVLTSSGIVKAGQKAAAEQDTGKRGDTGPPSQSIAKKVSAGAAKASAPADSSADVSGTEDAADASAVSRVDATADSTDPVLERKLDNLDRALKRRFGFFIRLWTLFWALIVAATFQVSAPELLSAFARGDISTAPYEQGLGDVLGLAESMLGDPRYVLVAHSALDELTARFPEHSDLIAEVGTVEGTKAQLLEEMNAVFAGSSARAPVVQAYSEILDRMAKGDDDTPPADIGDVLRQLEAYEIKFLGKGWKFYYDQKYQRIRWESIIGVLLMAILLSFGAPFWFEQLRTLASLRDLRARPEAKPVTSGGRIQITESKDGSRKITV